METRKTKGILILIALLQLVREVGWDPINWVNPSYLSACHKPVSGMSNDICRDSFLFSMRWFFAFCFWLNYLITNMQKLSFHNLRTVNFNCEWLLANVNRATIWWYDEDGVHFVLDQHAWGLYNASSLKQQSADRHVVPLGHIILISSQPFCTLTN